MWIESHQELRTHPKVARLASTLGIDRHNTLALLHLFWWWCVDFAPTGDITRFTATEISCGAEWSGDPQTLLDALTETGWIDQTAKRRRVHDWDDFAGKWIRRALAQAKRMREWRNKKSARDAHVMRTKRARLSHVRGDLTVPDLTVPDLTKHDKRVSTPSPSSPTLQAYRGIKGIKTSRRDQSILDRFVERYGESTVIDAIREHEIKIVAAERPLPYLGGILGNGRPVLRKSLTDRAKEIETNLTLRGL